MILAKYLEGFFVKKLKSRQKAYFHTLKWKRLLQLQNSMEEQFLSYFVSMHLFLNKIVYRKECKQIVIWPVVLTAPRGRVGVMPSGRTM